MWTSRPNDEGLNTYECYVEVNKIPVKTTVNARNLFDAQKLLEGQYGAENIRGMPYQIA